MIRVLVVDDDFMVARVNRGYVERVPGFVVAGEAYTGAAALTAAEELQPDLVLLDIYLPDMSGLDVLRRLRAAEGQSIDVLAVTAARNIEAVREAMQGGVVHYLIKPFTFSALAERLERYADARRGWEGATEAHQEDVDRMFGALRVPGSRPLPKGLSEATCDVVAGVLRESGAELSALEVAGRAGISRVSARRYLEHLVEQGRVGLRLRYGAGRPEHRYRLPGPGA